MKTTIEIEDGLFEKAQALARVEKTSVNALIEQGLRFVLDERAKHNLPPLPTVGGDGLTDEYKEKSWQEILDESYRGRGMWQLCREVEKSTKVPTYYFLMRYYSHPTEEFARRCPGCGGKWRTKAPEENRFRDWHFRCKRCRLVSNAGVEPNRRLARMAR
jgi:hypothetical protein